DPRWTGRWDKKRRIDLARAMLRTVQIERLITHRLPVEEAPTAYRLLEQEPERTLQVLFEYAK
ncbi:MAG: oxidoreductase, partial [Caldilinea sp.]|nr:oxidoreductase [Caldilinea sp.]MDW8439151.1 oxidoreductase [Caldilineaceae bacterium]